VREPKVQPVVVLWGPQVSKAFDEVSYHEGVTFCLGRALVDHLRSMDAAVPPATIDQAYDRLDGYVAIRDVGEARELDLPARPLTDHVVDLVLVFALASLTFIALGSALTLPPSGIWAMALAGCAALALSEEVGEHVGDRRPHCPRRRAHVPTDSDTALVCGSR
jgi:hypothetical protein